MPQTNVYSPLFVSRITQKPQPPMPTCPSLTLSETVLSMSTGPRKKLTVLDNLRICIKIIKTKQTFFPEIWKRLSPRQKLKLHLQCSARFKTVKCVILRTSSTKLWWPSSISKLKIALWPVWWEPKLPKRLRVSTVTIKSTSTYMSLKPNTNLSTVCVLVCNQWWTLWECLNKCKWWWVLLNLWPKITWCHSWCPWPPWCPLKEAVEIYPPKDLSTCKSNSEVPPLKNPTAPKNNSLMFLILEITFLILLS